jgi:hypothetical protein
MPSTNGLLDAARVEIKLGEYGVAPATALADVTWHLKTQDYRRQSAARMYPLDKSDIREKVPTADYHVSRKIDGEFTVLVYQRGHALTINPGGTVRLGMPWLAEACELLSRAGVKEALVAGELYIEQSGTRRPRVHDIVHIARQPASREELDRLRFAVFDLISLDGQPPPPSFEATWQTIERIFSHGRRVHPVETVRAKDSAEIERLFHEWVEEQGAEGLVVRSDTAGLFKIKPRHTLDVAVVGFTESTDERQGMLHDLLTGVMRSDGSLHMLTRVGGGFSEDVRRAMLADLKDMTADSEYVEVNVDHVAYQMVRPEWVIEISCLDLVSQTTRGGPVNRMVLNWNRGADRYQIIRRLPLASVISPQFLRRREDKRVQPFDVRIDQVAELVDVPLADRDAGQLALRASEILRREVYTKQLKGETMVRKFLMWKTNKEGDSEDFPAYVVHFTDFSPNRKEPLAREIRVSNSREQIETLWLGLKDANVKQGWSAHGSVTDKPARVALPPEPPAAVVAAAAKPLPRKAAAKKATTKRPEKKPLAKKPAKPAAKGNSPVKKATKQAKAKRARRKKSS